MNDNVTSVQNTFGAKSFASMNVAESRESRREAGRESIAYIVILWATFFQDSAGHFWRCEDAGQPAVDDARGGEVAHSGAETPAKMIVINQVLMSSALSLSSQFINS